MPNFPSNAWRHPPLSNQNNTHKDRFNLFLVPTLKYYSLATYYVWRYCLKLLLLTLVEGISLPYFTSVLLPKICFYKECSNPLLKIFLSKNKNNLISQSPKLILKSVDQSLDMQKKSNIWVMTILPSLNLFILQLYIIFPHFSTICIHWT